MICPHHPIHTTSPKYMKIRGGPKEKKKEPHPIDLYTSILKRVEKGTKKSQTKTNLGAQINSLLPIRRP
jgi:hypothetical protein